MTRHQKNGRRTKGAADMHGKPFPLSRTGLLSILRSSLLQASTEGCPWKCIAACAVYLLSSLTIVLLNRSILTKRFPFPVTLTWIQEILGTAFYAALSSVGKAACGAPAAEAIDGPPLSTRPPPKPSDGEFQACFEVSRIQPHGEDTIWRGSRRGGAFGRLRRWVGHRLSFLFPAVPLQLRALRRLLPASVALVGMVVLGNACLQRVQVSTYQVARSLTLVITLILQKFFLGIDVPRGAALSCGIVCLGFFIATLDTTTLSLGGAVTGVLASFSQAAYTTLIRQALDHDTGAEAAAMYYNMVNASFLLPPLIWASGEANNLHSHLSASLSQKRWIHQSDLRGGAEQPGSPTGALQVAAALGGGHAVEVVPFLVASGALAFFLTISTSWIISLTSPVTFGVLGYAKACAQTMLGFWLLSEKRTPQALAGVALTIGGSAMYMFCQRRNSTR